MKVLAAFALSIVFIGCQSAANSELRARAPRAAIKTKGEMVRVISDKDHYGISQFVGEKRVVVRLMKEKRAINEDTFRTDEVERVAQSSKKSTVRINNIEDQWGEVHMESTSGAVYVLMQPNRDKTRRFRWYEKNEIDPTLTGKTAGFVPGKEVFLVKEKTRAKIKKMTSSHIYVAFKRPDGSSLRKWVPKEEVVK